MKAVKATASLLMLSRIDDTQRDRANDLPVRYPPAQQPKFYEIEQTQGAPVWITYVPASHARTQAKSRMPLTTDL